jgi:phage shock protein A
MEIEMLKTVFTIFRSRTYDAAEALTDAQAMPILRQKLRDCAAGVETARRSVAMVMAYAEREKKSAIRVAEQLADLESRALDAIAKGREDLATEAAGAIAHLEAERDTIARAIATYDGEITRLRRVLGESENRLRDLQRGQRLALATEHTQTVRDRAPKAVVSSLDEAEATLVRLQTRQADAEATRAAIAELSAGSSADAMRDRLAAAGCGAPLRPDAAAVLERLRAKVA